MDNEYRKSKRDQANFKKRQNIFHYKVGLTGYSKIKSDVDGCSRSGPAVPERKAGSQSITIRA
jgi:hypothetical protein